MLARSSFVIPYPTIIKTGIDIEKIGIASAGNKQGARIECVDEGQTGENRYHRQALAKLRLAFFPRVRHQSLEPTAGRCDART